MKPDEKGPWAVARAFGAALTNTLGDRLAAAYVVGSLAHRAFVQGLSRIEVAVVVNGDRTDEAVDTAVDAARRAALGSLADAGTAHPEDAPPEIRCVVLGTDELAPPYRPERETAPEVLRLEDEGVRIAGSELRPSIQRPTAEELMAYVRYFDGLARETAFRTDSDELPPYYDLYGLAAAACRHYVFAKEQLVIWPKRDALVAFCMGHARHPRVPVARRLGKLGPMPDAVRVPPDTGDRVRELWCDVHREILR
jgi:hypothetical protein